ncbi:SIS domain-containing protein [Candidatus Pacearchaeota archaeon]|nr:SIS domain-containing protein [Candidatus Pacearchaeota archaeon]
MSIKSEIFSQPEVLSTILSDIGEIERVANEIRKRNITYVFLAARGTSDNAGLYAKYLWGAVNKLPLALAAPSLFSLYQSPPVMKDSIVVGVSQSGQSPDIIAVLEEGRKQGVITLAITNDTNSPLARVAEFVIDIAAGPEIAVAATKSYTAELMIIAILSTLLDKERTRLAELERVPDLISQVLKLDSDIERMAERYRYMQQCVVLGRGHNYATAFEWSLKLKEMAYVAAGPYSSADFQHGPIALVTQGFPVLAIAPKGAVYNNLMTLLTSLRNEYQTELVIISKEKEALSLAHSPIQLPVDLPEWLSPMVAIVPAQLFSFHLTHAKGFDAEKPRGLSKVTKTN